MEKEIKSISMGLNTEPYWEKADEVIKKFKISNDKEMVEWWEKRKKESEELRAEIIKTVEEDGVCELSWSCGGATRHSMHASQWAEALPQYDFEIGRYKCIVRKK